MVENMTHKHKQHDSVEGKGCHCGKMGVAPLYDSEEESGDGDIDTDGAHRIMYGILPLPDNIRERHGRRVAGETSPCARHVAVLGDEDYIDSEEDYAARYREPRSPDGLVYQLVPEGEVEINAHHYLRRHDDGHGAEAIPVLRTYDMLQDIHVGHDGEEGEEGEDDEELHPLGVVLLGVAVPGAGEDYRLIGETEGLGYHGHNHGYLHTRAILAQLGFSVGLVTNERVYYLVSRLVQYARYAEHEQRP